MCTGGRYLAISRERIVHYALTSDRLPSACYGFARMGTDRIVGKLKEHRRPDVTGEEQGCKRKETADRVECRSRSFQFVRQPRKCEIGRKLFW